MSTYSIEQLPTPNHRVAEGPHWDVKSQNLYYVDILGSINRYNVTENKVYTATIDNELRITFIIPIENQLNQFLVGISHRIGVIEWNGVSLKAKINYVAGEIDENLKTRFNDGKADLYGRLYLGTTVSSDDKGNPIGNQLGSFYHFSTQNKNFTTLLNNVRCSNGLTWNEVSNKFYFIDTGLKNIREYDVDYETGNISNERVIINFLENKSTSSYIPDGMTIDADGNLYVALFGLSKVIKVNPKSGTIDFEINIPCQQVTSVAFGGSNLDTLFVTTASIPMGGKNPPDEGGVFKVTGLGVKGTIMNNFKF